MQSSVSPTLVTRNRQCLEQRGIVLAAHTFSRGAAQARAVGQVPSRIG